MNFDEIALAYHREPKPGKVSVVPTKSTLTQRDLSLAYTPGVAVPCLRIKGNPDDVYNYTSKGNLVAVISNGTAVLGLGDIGAAAGKPVMEGKGVLFKRFGDIDVFDIEIDTHDVEELINTVKLIAPTFGGINLEDIKAPECFEVESRLIEMLDIPVFHDDQHGTAIIAGAGLLNALTLVEKRIGDIRMVIAGAGAAGISCAEHFCALGVRRENIVFVDSKGIVSESRSDLNKYKRPWASKTLTGGLAEAAKDADVFIGVSVKDTFTPAMLRTMARDPIVFAMANPDPEIRYEDAVQTRSDVIIATGRSDYPNQVNNVLGFPYIFRGALDTRAKAITRGMKLAATKALADLAREDVPDSVIRAYGGKRFHFGREYLIPKPFDPRLMTEVAGAVAKAALDEGVARIKIANFDLYREQLGARLDHSREVLRMAYHSAAERKTRIVFPEGNAESILRAAHVLLEEKLADPILLGDETAIRALADKLVVDIEGAQIVNPLTSDKREAYAKHFYNSRQRSGVTLQEAWYHMDNPIDFGCIMIDRGEADGLVSGAVHVYEDTMKPALKIIGRAPGFSLCAGFQMMILPTRVIFFGDCTINVAPDAEGLAEIAQLGESLAQSFHVRPKVAFVSFSNFGSSDHPNAQIVAKAAGLARKRMIGVDLDGEMQADAAVNPDVAKMWFPFSKIQGDANVLIFPDLASANSCYKILRDLGGAKAVGPIIAGLRHPVSVLSRGASVEDIVDICVITAQRLGPQKVGPRMATH
ncbi:MAG: NADP-dependent malic enzyme [Planctomycetes bacterium]|nr:NADP-dependent malic enzyme [Planctomycetota bacterium]